MSGAGNWGCCTPDGRCQQGPGCPAGTVFGQPPAQARPECVDRLRRVQLAAQPKPEAERGVLTAVLWGVVKGGLLAFAVVGMVFTGMVVVEASAPVAKTVRVVV